jgi:iron complex transport system permease protein
LALNVVASLLLVVVTAIAIARGTVNVPLDALIDAISGRGPRVYVLTVRDIRLPRVANGLLVGFALGVSGAIFQGLFRNSLASPDVLGVTSGASLGAFATVRATNGVSLVAPGAGIGGVVAAIAVYALSFKNGRLGRDRVVLVGVAVGAIASAFLAYLLTALPEAVVAAAARWQVGTMTGSSWKDVRLIAISVAICVPIALILMRKLLVMQFGDDLAASVGIKLRLTQLQFGACAVILATTATAASGPITFVALVCPHAARMLTRRASGGNTLLAGLLGALLIVVADWMALNVSPFPIPVGIVTAVIGAPYFLYLLLRGRSSV